MKATQDKQQQCARNRFLMLPMLAASLLLGGIGINMEVFEPLALAPPERRVISFDKPGVGKSPDPIFPYTMAQMALTCAALLDRLEIPCVDMLGISWGGALAQQFAFQNPRRCRRLVRHSPAANWRK